jgi:TonB-dependent receptor
MILYPVIVWRVLAVVACALVPTAACHAAEASKKSFAIPAGVAPAGDRPLPIGPTRNSPGGTVEGRVLNVTSGNFLNNARVRLFGTNLETFTNENGEYRLAGVPAGNQQIVASFTGLASRTENVTASPGAVARVDFELAIEGAPSGRQGDVVTLAAFTVEERELTGQAVALHERRNAPNIKNVIAIDVDTGEGNIGEFLKYVPGIGIDQSPQSPQFVSIRGMPASGTLVTTNGMEMASNSYTSGRETDLGVAATGNIDRIEVTKVPTPDMPANAVGGMINLITKSGFSRKKPLLSYNLYATVTTLDGLDGPGSIFSQSHGPDAKSNMPRTNPSLNLSYLAPVNQSLAFAFSLSKSDRYNDWDYRRPIWDKVNLRLTSNSMNALTYGEGKLLAATTVDWKVNADNTVSAGFSHSKQENVVRQNVVTSTFGANAIGSPTFIHGAATGVGSVTMDPIWTNQFKTLDLFTINHRFNGVKWKVDSSGAFSKVRTRFTDVSDGFFNRAASTTITNLILSNDQIGAAASRRTPIVTALNRSGAPVDIHNGNNYTLTGVSSAESDINNEGRRAAINVSRELDLPFALTLKTGVLFNRTRNQTVGGNRNWTFTPPGGAAARLIGNYDLIADAFSGRNHFIDANGSPVPVKWMSLAKIKTLYDAHPDWFVYNESGAYVAAVNAAKTIEETITASYVRGDAKFFENRLWLVGGIRFERTNDEGWGPLNDIRNTYQRRPDGSFVRTATGALVRITADAMENAKLQYRRYGVHSENRYEGFYPSLNASYWLTQNFVARAAYARTVGRPNFPEILPGVSATSPDAPAGSRTVTVINSALRPWTSDNYDLSLELYEMKGAVATVSLFRKDVSDFFGATRVLTTAETLAEFDLPEEYLGYDLVTKRNMGKANITGLEIGYRQSLEVFGAWGKGIQIFSNLTNLALGGANADNFTNFNPRTVQQTLSYTRRKFSAKVGYNYTWYRRRSPVAASATVPPDSYNTNAPQTKVDVSVAYMLARHYTLYADVRNLHGAPQRSGTWAPNTPEYARMDQLQFAGAAFTFGLRGDF